jgi:hypothetical protein
MLIVIILQVISPSAEFAICPLHHLIGLISLDDPRFEPASFPGKVYIGGFLNYLVEGEVLER